MGIYNCGACFFHFSQSMNEHLQWALTLLDGKMYIKREKAQSEHDISYCLKVIVDTLLLCDTLSMFF